MCCGVLHIIHVYMSSSGILRNISSAGESARVYMRQVLYICVHMPNLHVFLCMAWWCRISLRGYCKGRVLCVGTGERPGGLATVAEQGGSSGQTKC